MRKVEAKHLWESACLDRTELLWRSTIQLWGSWTPACSRTVDADVDNSTRRWCARCSCYTTHKSFAYCQKKHLKTHKLKTHWVCVLRLGPAIWRVLIISFFHTITRDYKIKHSAFMVSVKMQLWTFWKQIKGTLQSPDLNPIVLAFAQFKKRKCKMASHRIFAKPPNRQ